MTAKEEEVIQQWVDQKKEDPNTHFHREDWHDKETDKDWLGLSYWWWHQGQEYRVFKIGTSLEEVVKLCQEKEEKICKEAKSTKK